MYRSNPAPFVQPQLRPMFNVKENIYNSTLSARAATTPIMAPFRHAKVSFGAAPTELLVPMTFPFTPQFAPKHGA